MSDALTDLYYYVKRWQLLSSRPSLKTIINHEYDIIFYCEQPGHWHTIDAVLDCILSSNKNLNCALFLSFSKDASKGETYPDDCNVNFGVPKFLLKYFKSKILYTPYTGMQKRQKPQNCKVIHSLVSLTSLDGVYPKNSFDNYDYILCAGDHHINDFKRWASVNSNLGGVILVPAGYPKLDKMRRNASQVENLLSDTTTIVYAPTHVYQINEKLASLRKHGDQIIAVLLEAGYRVIFRPHPVSFVDQDKELVNEIVKKYSSNNNFILDRSNDYLLTYSKANLMVTDLSGTGFTFSLSFSRPSIFFSHDPAAEKGMVGIQFDDRDKLGGVVRTTHELLDRISELTLMQNRIDIPKYRNDLVYEIGNSNRYIANTVMTILNDEISSDWIKL